MQESEDTYIGQRRYVVISCKPSVSVDVSDCNISSQHLTLFLRTWQPKRHVLVFAHLSSQLYCYLRSKYLPGDLQPLVQLYAVGQIVLVLLKRVWSSRSRLSARSLLTISLTKEGGTLRPVGIMTEPRFCLVSRLKMLNQSMLKIVRSPGSSKVMVSPLYARSRSRLKQDMYIFIFERVKQSY